MSVVYELRLTYASKEEAVAVAEALKGPVTLENLFLKDQAGEIVGVILARTEDREPMFQAVERREDHC